MVFIDEAGAKTNMIRMYGRAMKGKRVYDYAPHAHWSATTMISSIRYNGETACMVVESSTTSRVFRAYVEHVLVPALKNGDTVILDNLSSHKDEDSIAIIEKTGAQVRFLPPYSPDMNPIEKMWSKVKQILRGAKARSREALLDSISFALSCVTESDSIGWFGSCGYTLT